MDDNRDVADGLCMLLRRWGYECRPAYDGAEGLQAACDYQPDCLLLDIAMPGLDGYMLAREVRAQPALNRAKLIALAAYSDVMHAQFSQEAGFDYHFVKPPNIPDIKRLKDTLDEIVRLTSEAEEMTRQNVALASEAKDLIKEVKADIKEGKEHIRENKEQVKELREDVREVKEARAEKQPR